MAKITDKPVPPKPGDIWYELHASCTAERAKIGIDRIEGEVAHIRLSRFNGKVGGYAREWRKV